MAFRVGHKNRQRAETNEGCCRLVLAPPLFPLLYLDPKRHRNNQTPHFNACEMPGVVVLLSSERVCGETDLRSKGATGVICSPHPLPEET